jgi:hypothetical protein
MVPFRRVQLRPDSARFLLDGGHLFYSALSGKADLSKMEQFALKVMNYGGVVFTGRDARYLWLVGANPITLRAELVY